VNRCAVVPAVAATDASSIHGTLHDASGRPLPVGLAREPHFTEATTVASTPRVDGQTGESVDLNGRVHPADGVGQESRGGDLHAWTGPTGAARPSGKPHASPVLCQQLRERQRFCSHAILMRDTRWRRLVRDCERRIDVSEAIIYVSVGSLSLRRLRT
jgi:hypothetical protein